MSVTALKSSSVRGCVSSGDSGRGSVSLPFSARTGCHVPGLRPSSLQPLSQQEGVGFGHSTLQFFSETDCSSGVESPSLAAPSFELGFPISPHR